MLWPLILPFWIELVMLIAFVASATVVAPVVRLNRGLAFLFSILIAIVGFVPLFWLTMEVVNAVRFGTFQHRTFQDVRDHRVERYLPDFARDILIDKHAQGFCAKFKADERTLAEWHADRCKRWKIAVEPPRPMHKYESHRYDQYFSRLNWPMPKDALVYTGVHAGNGAGFELWYSQEEGLAYQAAGYW